MAEALVSLHNRYKEKEQTDFSISVSREDPANIAGTATESAIRILSDFKEEGLIDIRGGTIAILNYDKLDRMKS